MEETMNTSMEQTPTSDAFLEGLAEAEAPETADQPGEGTEEETPDTTGVETETEEGTHPNGEGGGADTPSETKGGAEGAEAETEDGSGERQKDAAPPSWDIKHMGEARTVTAAEITPELLQKGMDYDRVRERYDEAKPVMELLGQFAQSAGMSVTDYARYIRAETMKATGMSEAEAKRTMELEDREAAIAAKEAEGQQVREREELERTKVAEDVTEFAKAFPDVFAKAKDDPKVIPQSVWKDVRSGMSLSAAYSRYAVAQAQVQAETSAKNAANAARAAGSMRSAGNEGRNNDAFLDGFDD